MLEFLTWLGRHRKNPFSLRDILAWVDFINATGRAIGPAQSYIHGACLVWLDAIGSSASSGGLVDVAAYRREALAFLVGQCGADASLTMGKFGFSESESSSVVVDSQRFGLDPFFISIGPLYELDRVQRSTYALDTPTTKRNLLRVMRGLQVRKPILLEGSPGVGKTSFVQAIARASGHGLVRINLSEQTDLMDLFGSDLPVDGGSSGEFAWRNGPFLQAFMSGDWILLDELNLASQSVLEGLNACFDHRGEIYVPELDRSFTVDAAQPSRIFACQNPFQQGGGRKGLPRSFLNRFTVVFMEPQGKEDLLQICRRVDAHPELGAMIEFNTRMHHATMIERRFGRAGSPWEFNVRDVLRWLELTRSAGGDPGDAFDLCYLQRLRTSLDRIEAIKLFHSVFGRWPRVELFPRFDVSDRQLTIGDVVIQRDGQVGTSESRTLGASPEWLLEFSAPLMHLARSLEADRRGEEQTCDNRLAMVVGSSATGKTSLIRLLANCSGRTLKEFSMSSGIDTTEILGGYEQISLERHRECLLSQIEGFYRDAVTKCLGDSPRLKELHVRFLQVKTALRTTHDLSVGPIDADLDSCSTQLQESSLTDTDRSGSLVNSLRSLLDVCDLALPLSNALMRQAESIVSAQAANVAGRFEWINSVLVDSIEQGHWVLLDNANFCSPAVLDRLNSLIEPQGELLLNERGSGVDGRSHILRPHPSFRLLLTLDPRFGEVSRAMRNRGVELVLLPSRETEVYGEAVAQLFALPLSSTYLVASIPPFDEDRKVSLVDQAKLLMYHGMPSLESASALVGLFNTMSAASEQPIVRYLLLFVRLFVERLARGAAAKSALILSFKDVLRCSDSDAAVWASVLMSKLNSRASSRHCPSPIYVSSRLFLKDCVLARTAQDGSLMLRCLSNDFSSSLAEKVADRFPATLSDGLGFAGDWS